VVKHSLEVNSDDVAVDTEIMAAPHDGSDDVTAEDLILEIPTPSCQFGLRLPIAGLAKVSPDVIRLNHSVEIGDTACPDLEVGGREQKKWGPESQTLSPQVACRARETSTFSSRHFDGVEVRDVAGHHLELRDTIQKKWGSEPRVSSSRVTGYSARQTSTAEKTANPDLGIGGPNQRGPEPWTLSSHDTCYSACETSTTSSDLRQYLQGIEVEGAANTDLGLEETKPKKWGPEPSALSSCDTCDSARETSTTSSELVNPDLGVGETKQKKWGPEPWAKSCDTCYSVHETSSLPTSYRNYLRCRGSLSMKNTSFQKHAASPCSQANTSPAHSMASVDSNTNTPSSARVSTQMNVSPLLHVTALNSAASQQVWQPRGPKNTDGQCILGQARIPASMPNCHQQAQTQSVPVVSPSQTAPLFNSLQLLPPVALERCQSAHFLEQMPAMPSFSENMLSRSETLPNLWSVCSPRSFALAHDAQPRDVNLMAIAMPDAFSLSRSEIAAQLRLAAPCTYED